MEIELKPEIDLKSITIPQIVFFVESNEELHGSVLGFRMDVSHRVGIDGMIEGIIDMGAALKREEEHILEVLVKGTFRLKGIPDGKIEQFLRINCAAILYPYLREKVTTLTVMAGYNPYYMPSKNFIQQYNEWKEQQEKQNPQE